VSGKRTTSSKVRALWVTRNTHRKHATEVLFYHGKGQVDAGRHACRRLNRAIAHPDRVSEFGFCLLTYVIT
jgi:hypothetical protein